MVQSLYNKDMLVNNLKAVYEKGNVKFLSPQEQ